MSLTDRMRAFYLAHPLASDVFLAVSLMLVSLVEIQWTLDQEAWDRLALVAAGTLPFAARRHSPAAAALIMLLAAGGLEIVAGVPAATIVAALSVFYLIGLTYPKPRADQLRIAVVLPFGLIVLGRYLLSQGELSSVLLSLVLVPGVWMLSETVAGRRANQRALEERNRELEEAREDQITLAVERERNAIARELHDIVAHNISVIVVQAGAAHRVVGSKPDQASRALESIEAAARKALAEMRLVLGVMRGESGLEPQPGLTGLEELVGQVKAAGLNVNLTIEGERQPLPGAVELSAYRIIQEALTNTIKHGGEAATAEVVTRYTPDLLIIDVLDNGIGASDESRRGHGLIGIGERVAMLGGRIEVGNLSSRGFRVHAELPVRGSA